MWFWLSIQLLVILFFFVMFWRGSKLVWGIGLLTVVTATLFSTVLSIFGREQLAEEMGLWYSVVSGILIGGGGIWLWGVLRPVLQRESGPAAGPLPAAVNPVAEARLSRRAASMSQQASGYDLQLLHDQIRQNLGPEDVLDLIFDLEINENEVVAPTRNMHQTIANVIDLAIEREQMADLALGVERILTPVPPDHFPRVENLQVDTPPTILRRYLLAFYFLDDLEKIAAELEVPWELLGLTSKQGKVRNLLLYLKRRSRLQELIDILHRENNQQADS